MDKNIDEKVEDELENLSLDKEDAYEPPSGVEPSVEPTEINDVHNSDDEEAVETTADDVEDQTDEMEVDDNKQRDLEVSDEHHQEGLEETIAESIKKSLIHSQWKTLKKLNPMMKIVEMKIPENQNQGKCQMFATFKVLMQMMLENLANHRI